jgi:F0F1-type ATP synthase delta subunit
MINSKDLAKIALKNIEAGVSLNIVLEKTEIFLKEKKLHDFYKPFLEKLSFMLQSKLVYEKASIESPFPLSDEDTKSILNKFSISSTQVEHKINKDLLAGFRVVSEGRLIDASVQKVLNSLKQKN